MLAATLVAAVLVVLGAPAQAEVQMVEPATDPERMLASLLE